MEKRISRRDFVKATAATLGAAILAGCTPQPAATPAVSSDTGATKPAGSAEPVKIGVLQPLSGAASLLGTSLKTSYTYAAEIINQEGGIKSLGGAPIELVWADHQNKQDLAVNETERLVQQEKVSLVAGAATSGAVMAATTAADRLECPFVVEVPAATNITQRGLKYTFRINAIGYKYGELFRDWTAYANKELNANIKKVAFVYPDTEAARSFLGAAAEYAAQNNLEVVFDEAFPADTQDFTTLLTRVKITNPDVVTTNDASLTAAIQYLKQAAAIGLKPMIFSHANGTAEFSDWGDAAGELGEGYTFMAQWNPDLPGAKPLYDDFLAKTNEKLTGFSALGIQAVYTIAEALEAAASREPKVIREALTKLKMTPGPRLIMPWQSIEFDETGQNTGAFDILIQWQDGEKRTVFPVELASRPLIVPFDYWKKS